LSIIKEKMATPETEPPKKLPEPKVKTDPEFEAMFKEAEAAYPDVPKFLLRVALHTALREEEAHRLKRIPKKKHIIDVSSQLEDEYLRAPPAELEYYGMEIIPPKDKEDGTEPIVECVSESAEETGQVSGDAGQRADLEGGRGHDDDHIGASVGTAV
jgi:hypothetical protein